MNYRTLGKTGFNVSELSLGTWQLGGVWGTGFDHHSAQRLLEAAFDEGVNFFDTADVYEDGESEMALGAFFLNADAGPPENIIALGVYS